MLNPAPVHLPVPNSFVLRKNTIIHQVHDRNFLGNSFDPTDRVLSRFSPIWSNDGDIIAGLYASSTLEAAICETIFHDIQPHIVDTALDTDKFALLIHTILNVNKDIRLASLRHSDLKSGESVEAILLIQHQISIR